MSDKSELSAAASGLSGKALWEAYRDTCEDDRVPGAGHEFWDAMAKRVNALRQPGAPAKVEDKFRKLAIEIARIGGSVGIIDWPPVAQLLFDLVRQERLEAVEAYKIALSAPSEARKAVRLSRQELDAAQADSSQEADYQERSGEAQGKPEREE